MFFNAELVEMVMVAKPEYFVPEDREITVYENKDFWQVGYKEKSTSSRAEDILYTAHAIEMKYGTEKAIGYVKRALK